MVGRIERRLYKLGLSLPERCTPRGNFLPYRLEGHLVFMAGQICEWNGAIPYVGPVMAEGEPVPNRGPSVDLATGKIAARICALNLLFHLRAACGGDLDRLQRVVRVGGFVNCTEGFGQSPAVINGASDLFIELCGDDGWHARTAVGVSGLPGNASVEVDAIFALS
jgi:enamine deaminase RidA (YjgF/YER057c/UK114 family)